MVDVVVDVVDRTPVGMMLRDWRRRRRRSQLDLALDAGVSARHLSFVETGRSRPSRSMVLLLAEQLEVPLRDRNQLLLAAGFAPTFVQRPLGDPEMAPIRDALEVVLKGYEPYPALVVDRLWNLVAANASVPLLLQGVDADLLTPPMNVLRVSLHPRGAAGQIINLAQVRAYILDRLARDAAVTAAPELVELHRELLAYPGGIERDGVDHGLAVPLRMRAGEHELAFISTVTTFGTAVDITTAELSVEAFLPADAETAQLLPILAANLAAGMGQGSPATSSAIGLREPV
ncbi:MAG: helix-turn-helix domain-containing protein [Geodermatophilaceae bacterium]